MRASKLGLSALAIVALALPTLAGIHKKAGSTAHQLDNASVAIHDYLHDAGYPSSYGAHGMELAADTLHTAMHNFGNGNATEADVLDNVAATTAALEAMRDSFRANGIWADRTAKKLYDDCHRLTVLMNAYTN